MARDAAWGEPDALIPLTLAEQACIAQREWAPAYARAHRARRALSWLVAVGLCAYVSFFLIKAVTYDSMAGVGVAGTATYTPLLLIGYASTERRLGGGFPSAWAFAWIFLLIDAAVGGVSLFGGRAYSAGVSCILAALGIGGVLAAGLHIPYDPSVDWRRAFLEQLMCVRTARGGLPYQTLITGHQQAEEIAASWVRRLGYRDARATKPGPDDGIDVASFGAVAQVKYWANTRVPIKEVQRLAGTANRGQVPLFFARYGYTRPALRWADNPGNRVRLFILQPDGNIVACNYLAKRALWDAPEHLPAEHRRPISYRNTLPYCVFMLICSVFFSYASIYVVVSDRNAWWLMFAFLTAITIGATAEVSYRPIQMIIKNARGHRPLDVRRSFTLGVSPDPNSGLPSDLFIGYQPSLALRLVNMSIDLQVRHRIVKRIILGRRARRHKSQSPV